MAQHESSQRKLDHIRVREWGQIKDGWLGFIPRISPAGAPPAVGVNQVAGMEDFAKEVFEKGELRIQDGELGLRQSVLSEGIYLLHKSTHILGAGGAHLLEGISTWSISSFYQASLFGIRAIMSFLGVSLPEFSGRTLIVDLWPEDSPAQKKIKKKGGLPPVESHFTKLGARLDHHTAWYAFLRLLRTAKVPIWPCEYVDALRLLDVGRISDQRNALHYRVGEWLFDDLHLANTVLRLVNLEHSANGFIELDCDRDDFTVALSVIVLRLGALLFDDLRAASALLEDEWNLFASAVGTPFHLVYSRSHLGC